MRKAQWQEQKLKFHYLLRPSLETQLVSALCGPGIFTALASPFFIVVFLSYRLAVCDAITCSLPPVAGDTDDNYTIFEGSACQLKDGHSDDASCNDCIFQDPGRRNVIIITPQRVIYSITIQPFLEESIIVS